jgi:hypothetical protein
MDLASPQLRGPKPRHPRTKPCRYGSGVVRRAPPPGGSFFAGAAAALSDDDVDRRPGSGAGQGRTAFLERDGQNPELLIPAASAPA